MEGCKENKRNGKFCEALNVFDKMPSQQRITKFVPRVTSAKDDPIIQFLEELRSNFFVKIGR